MRSSSPTKLFGAVLALSALLAATTAEAAQCGNGAGGFQTWLGQFKREAAAKGISARTIKRALSGISYNPKIIRLDRGQRSFKQSFAQFYKRRASPWLLKKARGKLKRHARLLSGIEKRYGVPPEIIITIWGMESTFRQPQRQNEHRPLPRNPCLRLPPLRLLHQRTARRPPHHPARRHEPETDARRLGR